MRRVLVIDDEDLLRETLREMLEDAGYDVAGGVPDGARSDLPLAATYGAQRTLQKPCTRAELLRAVADLLG